MKPPPLTAAEGKKIEAIEGFLLQARRKSDFQRGQCVLLRLKFGMNSSQTGSITGYSENTVRKIWSLYNREGVEGLICRKKGGRRNAYMTPDEEKLFLSPFFRKSESDGRINIKQIHSAYERRMGQKVPKSTIYRLLKRHGWKKQLNTPPPEPPSAADDPNGMNSYWIEGCAQAILPKRTGNISQQWLNSTLSSMVGGPPSRLE